MPTLALDLDELKANLGMIMGIGRNPLTWSTADTDDAERLIRAGKRMLLAAHNWTFLEQNIQILTVAPYDTGTITVVNGVVTLAGGTWASTAAGQKLVPEPEDPDDDTGVFQVASRDSNTQITLEDTSLNLPALTPFTLYTIRYAMPTNFGGFMDPITLENSSDNPQELVEFPVFPEWTTRILGNRITPKSGRPQLFSTTQEISETAGIPTYYLTVYPLPDDVYVMNARMNVQPGDGLDVTSGDIFHPVFSELLQEAVLATAETMYNDSLGTHNQKFSQMLPLFIKKDSMMRGVRRLPPRFRRNANPLLNVINAPVVYDGLP